MKTNLFYFSATGNSLVVAKDIAAGLPGTQIFPIPQVINGQIDLDADNIGLIFPVFFSGIPRMISDFIKRLEPEKVKYIFAVCTYGGFPANTLLETQEQLKAAGIPLNAGYFVQMPGNYIVKYGAYKKEKQEKMFQSEKETVRRIIKDIENQKNSRADRSNFLFNRIGKSVYKSKLPQLPTLDKNFTADEKCNGCSICEKVCPARNIQMADHKPEWQGNCEHCMACLQWCPREAIQYSAITTGRKRYRHPDVKAADLFIEKRDNL